mgnify:CR=1 FL=1
MPTFGARCHGSRVLRDWQPRLRLDPQPNAARCAALAWLLNSPFYGLFADEARCEPPARGAHGVRGFDAVSVG